ncbi:Hypothetical protein HDN1F_30780 [gamma proteobacterium HdN1]|nr:Hypothetical protein HDN1F_30780 [gamma proteobacterium HdN1]
MAAHNSAAPLQCSSTMERTTLVHCVPRSSPKCAKNSRRTHKNWHTSLSLKARQRMA